MNVPLVPVEAEFLAEFPTANLTFLTSGFSAMNNFQMYSQVGLLCKIPAANLALVSGAISAVNIFQMFA